MENNTQHGAFYMSLAHHHFNSGQNDADPISAKNHFWVCMEWCECAMRTLKAIGVCYNDASTLWMEAESCALACELKK
jgi:hypothetical protein